MHLIRFIFVLALALCASWSQSAAPAGAAPVGAAAPSAAATAPPADYKLGPGDSIRVQVFQNPDLTVEARVSETGSIRYPLVGSVDIGGLSIGQAEAKVADALKAGQFLKAPQVNIVMLQVRGNQVSVLGQVNRPGRFPLETFNVRVSDMLAAAGGVTPTGDDSLVVSGTRSSQPFRKVIDIPALFSNIRGADDIVLAAGDTIYVNTAPVYYIYGEAQKPGSYRVQRGMTVMQALAQGGGPTARGSQNRLRLDRTRPDGSVVQITPKLTDPVQAGDVLFVRESIF
jgi:polysaccharide biosynthesis/export protein